MTKQSSLASIFSQSQQGPIPHQRSLSTALNSKQTYNMSQ